MMSKIIQFDPENKQEPYTYMARSLETNEYVIGNVVVEAQWCEHPDSHKYFIVSNEYKNSNFCGGMVRTGFKYTEVDPKTLEPYTQIAMIRYVLELTIPVKLKQDIEGVEHILAIIESEDQIPLHLWNN